MQFPRFLYLVVAFVSIVLAFSSPWWLPEKWIKKPITKQQTQSGGNWPTYGSDVNNANAEKKQESKQQTTTSTSNENRNDNKKKQQPIADHEFPFSIDDSAENNKNDAVRVFSKEELAQYNGETKDKPLYLVVLGEVFDVTSGERFYAKGNGYNCFVGKDNSAAFHSGKFNDTVEDVRTLPNPAAVQGVVGWRSFFRNHETYRFVGVVDGLYFDAKGNPTPVLDQVLEMNKNVKAGEAEDQRRAKLFPRCNMHYDGIKKITNVWCDGYQSPDDLRNVNRADPELRVLRMVHFTVQATGAEMKDCRCLRLNHKESEIGSAPWPSAMVDYYFKERGCDPNSPRCTMSVG